MTGSISESSGIKELDNLLGGLFVGDNVLLETEVGTFSKLFIEKFIEEGLRKNREVVYISFNSSPLTLVKRFEKISTEKLTILDCFTEGKGHGERIFQKFYDKDVSSINVIKIELPQVADYFHRIFDQITGDKGNYTRYIFDSVTGMQELWGDESKIQEFYTHTCPMLFDLKTIAYWVLDKHVHSTTFKANLEHIGQVTIELSRVDDELFLQVKSATKRYNPKIYAKKKYEIQNSTIRFI
jgi:KaiC/GvpD/RAD55 family RecA-like ATPase